MHPLLHPFAAGSLVLSLTALSFSQAPVERAGADPGLHPPQPSFEGLREGLLPDLEAERARVFTAQREEAFWVRGSDYKARFAPQGTTYIPLLGPKAEHRPELTLGVPSLQAGLEAIALQQDVAPEGSATEVRFERGPLTEWYRLSPEGIEQLFTFEHPPGAGPLTVTIPVHCDLEPTENNGGLAFHNEFGGVHYGSATVLDAAGTSLALETRWLGSAIEITVPEAFLANAQWPVTIDPLITTMLVDAWNEDLLYPDIAYDPTSNTVLIVYEEVTGPGDRDVYWRLVTPTTGAIVDSNYFDLTTDDWGRPRVAQNTLAGAYLIVAEHDLGTFQNVGYRVVDSSAGTQGMILGVDATEFVSNQTPDVGGETFPTGSSYWYVTWVQENTSGARRVMATRVDQAGVCTFDGLVLSSLSTQVFRPAISNNAKETSLWDVVWESGPSGARNVHGAMVRYDGTLIAADHLIANPVGGAQNPAVSGYLGGTNLALVVYEEPQVGGSVDLIGTVLDFNQPQFHQNLTDQAGIALNAVRGEPRVDNDLDSFVVVWSEEVGPGNRDVFASTFHLLGDNLCESESRVGLHNGGLPQSELHPAVCSTSQVGGPEHSTFAAWSLLETTSANIYMAQYNMPTQGCLGRAYCNPAVPNSTNQLGRLTLLGSPVAALNNVTLHADQMPPNQFGYFVCGTDVGSFIPPGSQGRLCLGGSLGRYNRTVGEILNSGPSGSFSLAIDTSAMPTNPNQPILAGQSWTFQAWHRDLNPGQTSNFTRAVEVIFQ